MVMVTVSETYDLSTKQNKMALIGIHTPKKEVIQKSYPGLLMNCKYIRIVKQDVTLACASMLPVDPTKVGIDDGQVAPQDMFNPILYKAVSNDSMSTIEARLHGLQVQSGVYGKINGSSLIKTDDATTFDNDFEAYYALLANRDGFRTAHPQQGLKMNGLVPLVFEKYYNVGQNKTFTVTGQENNEYPVITQTTQGLTLSTTPSTAMRGRPHPMPKFNTTYITSSNNAGGVGSRETGMGETAAKSHPFNAQTEMPDILPVYTACIIMPPCKQNQIYYRMVVRTTIEFTDVRPIQEITSLPELSYLTPYVYASDYDTQVAQMTKSLGMVDTQDAEIEKIMEGH